MTRHLIVAYAASAVVRGAGAKDQLNALPAEQYLSALLARGLSHAQVAAEIDSSGSRVEAK
ncbi:hypothetical protein ABZ471_38225 [Streptomyces sp. NPDC005728]|uniref:hypothetical protein n=1 Tax=Streptomyces sp. NPDC005728 TaxID=3157054 RepID=UPI00340A9E2B